MSVPTNLCQPSTIIWHNQPVLSSLLLRPTRHPLSVRLLLHLRVGKRAVRAAQIVLCVAHHNRPAVVKAGESRDFRQTVRAIVKPTHNSHVLFLGRWTCRPSAAAKQQHLPLQPRRHATAQRMGANPERHFTTNQTNYQQILAVKNGQLA